MSCSACVVRSVACMLMILRVTCLSFLFVCLMVVIYVVSFRVRSHWWSVGVGVVCVRKLCRAFCVSSWMVSLFLGVCCFRVSSALVTMRFWMVCCVWMVNPLCWEWDECVCGCMACI